MSEYIIDGSDRRSPKAARNAGIYEERKAGAKFIEIAGKYGLTVERIRQICRKEQWYRSRIDGLQPIVRCRDCKYYTPESMSREERGFGVYEDVWEPGGCFNPKRCSISGDPFGEWHVVGIDTEPNGFCAWGERGDA